MTDAPKKRKGVSRGRHAAVVRMVIESRFPKAFMPKGFAKRPLKVGIFHDLVAAFSGTLRSWEIEAALADYTGGPTYLRSMIEGAPRIDLEGNGVGTVNAEAAHEAAERLAKIREHNDAQAAAKAAEAAVM
jgi:sRNA-binding protein